jgi:4-diphosphocytidyl-2-C-methyl-D-erythritol kinase
VATMHEGEWPEGWVGRMCRSLEVHPLAGWLG